LIYIKRAALGFAKGKRTVGSGSAGRVMTSAVRFVKETQLGSVFDDQATKAMGEAFDAACKVLDEARQLSVVYEAVAKCIIEIAKSGERDPNQLRDRALTACGHKRLISLLPALTVSKGILPSLRIFVRYRAPVSMLTQHQGRCFAAIPPTLLPNP